MKCVYNVCPMCPGVVYIKYAKTSSAAKALEDMNGKVIINSVRPIKVVVASK